MARSRITTVRLDAADQRALTLAKRDGIGASELIRRGLRAVAPAYYRDGAAPSVDPETDALRAWRAERAAFFALPPAKLARHRGLWVAVQGGQIVRTDTDLDRLSRAMRDALDPRPFFITRVGALPEVVDMPGFEIERP